MKKQRAILSLILSLVLLCSFVMPSLAASYQNGSTGKVTVSGVWAFTAGVSPAKRPAPATAATAAAAALHTTTAPEEATAGMAREPAEHREPGRERTQERSERVPATCTAAEVPGRCSLAKAAKAAAVSSQAQLESARTNAASQFRMLYDQAVALSESMRSMRSALASQNSLEILGKALDAGQISVIDYFTEANLLFESRGTLLQIERDYQSAVAALYSFSL